MGLVTRITAYCDGKGCLNKIVVGALREYVNTVLRGNDWHPVLHSNYIWYYCPDCYDKEKERFEDVEK